MAKVHRMHRHNWWRPSKEITTRDCQAMRNFHDEGVPLETIAEHFGCSVEYAEKMVNQRPWLQSSVTTYDWQAKGSTWWESDHSDPLELIKLFYSQYLPEGVSTEVCAQESHAATIDPETYLEKKYGLTYVNEENIKAVQEAVNNILACFEEEQKPLDIAYAEKLLDRMIA